MDLKYGMGWIPDLPDNRDYTLNHPKIREQIDRMGAPVIPTKVDLRTTQALPPIDHQGQFQSCTAFASCALLEFFQLRSFNNYLETSKMFTYKVTRNILDRNDDKGAFNRTAIQSLVMFGSPPKQYWPYNPALLNAEPSPFVYALAGNYQATKFYRYDPQGADYDTVLQDIKRNLAAVLPAMFGFYVFRNCISDNNEGHVFFPTTQDLQAGLQGGHAVMAVGYDDDVVIKNPSDGQETRGAILFRNSWGPGWGNQGYGWLPYEYVRRAYAIDWWSIISAEYADTGNFGFGQLAAKPAGASAAPDDGPADVGENGNGDPKGGPKETPGPKTSTTKK